MNIISTKATLNETAIPVGNQANAERKNSGKEECITDSFQNGTLINEKSAMPEIRNLKGAVIGSVVGATALASAGVLSNGVIGGIVGGITGAVIGGKIGSNIMPITYDMKAVGRWIKNAASSIKGSISNKFDNIEIKMEKLFEKIGLKKTCNPELLGKSNLKAASSTGDIRRKYDGYDSSRNIFAVYLKEGNENEKYTFQVEMANLRHGAERGYLDTYVLLNWGNDKGSSSMPFALEDNKPVNSWKLAIKIDNRKKFEMIDSRENKLDSNINSPVFSPTFSNLEFQLDKESLRNLGWKDGTPLNFQVLTSKDGESEVTDRLTGQSDVSNPDEIMKNVFRWEGKSIYYAVTDRFNNGDKTNDYSIDSNDQERFHGGDWQGLIDKLDYIDSLGVDALWISCPYLNDRSFFGKDGYHGYWPHDFFKTEPQFGDMEKLKELVSKAHEKGIKVLLDVVVNHTGYDHPFTKDGKHENWFHHEGDLKSIGQYHMENAALAGLPDLDQDNPEVVKHLIDAHKMWINETGVDGFRMDAVRHVPEPFLREFNEEMHNQKDNFLTIGEAFWLEPNFVAGYQNRCLDSMFDFTLAYVCRDVFASDKKRSLKDRIRMAREFFMNNPNEAIRELFSPNGGSMRRLSLATIEDRFFDNPKKLATLIDNHDMIRFMSDTGGNKDQLEIALAFLMGSRGMPAIYYGTEIAMDGAAGSNRKDMEFGNNPEFTDKFRNMALARKSSSALQFGAQKELMASRNAYAYTRLRPDEEVICVFNNSDSDQQLKIPIDEESRVKNGDTLKDMMSDYSVKVENGKLNVHLKSKGYCFLRWTK